VSVSTRFQFQILDNPLLATKDAPDVVLVADDDGTILGQVLLQRSTFTTTVHGRAATWRRPVRKGDARNTRAAARSLSRSCAPTPVLLRHHQ